MGHLGHPLGGRLPGAESLALERGTVSVLGLGGEDELPRTGP